MTASLSEAAYNRLRSMIVRLEFAPGDVLREDDLREQLGIGRTPIREALQRLEREHFVKVVPRQGIFVTGIDVSELSMLFETRSVLEPYAARLAALRGTDESWDAMEEALDRTVDAADGAELLAIDRTCHEIMWQAAGNRFLIDTLDMLYAQSDRLWHLYLADVADPGHAVEEHVAILNALRSRESDIAASLVDDHVASFDAQIRDAVTARLTSPLAG
ncbi:GntR family transcriptional regulator [bacterium]|jgi:DNA-binding GntR family transcriptional regulator|nr:GntR family transcriptional regulator [bacterium]